MTTKFLHTYQLDFGTPLKLPVDGTPIIPFIDFESYVKSHPRDFNFYRIDGLQMSFNTDKGMSTKDTTSITIENLSDNMANYLHSIGGNKGVVFLSAGYNGDNKTIIRGTIEKVENKHSTTTRDTILSISSGAAATREVFDSRPLMYSKGTSYRAIVDDLLNEVKLVRGTVYLDHLLEKTIPSNFYREGNVVQQLTRLGESLGDDFFIVDGTACYMPKNYRSSKEVTVISPSSGLLDYAERVVDEVGTDSGKETNAQYTFKCMLDGAIQPGVTVYLESKVYTGALKVTKCRHRGTFRGNDWYTEVVGEAVPFTF